MTPAQICMSRSMSRFPLPDHITQSLVSQGVDTETRRCPTGCVTFAMSRDVTHSVTLNVTLNVALSVAA